MFEGASVRAGSGLQSAASPTFTSAKIICSGGEPVWQVIWGRQSGGPSAVPECDPAFGQIVGGKFEGDFVARQNANAIAPQAPGEMRENDPVMFQLHAEETAGKFFQNGPGYFDTVFLAHSTSLKCGSTLPAFTMPDWRPVSAPARHCGKLAGNGLYVGCLQPLWACGHLELHPRALIERLVTARLNRRKMDENIFPRLALNKAEAFGSVKPLHSTFLSHYQSSSKFRTSTDAR